MASRVLITEPLAQVAMDTLTAAGFDVDVAVGLSPEELLGAVRGASALVIRSATQVNAEVLEAGTDLVVVGRAGIGLDNVDVAAATRKGVMVVNAPQSNILSAAEHTMALLISQARNVPQADADLKAGNWRRSKWEGVELHGKTLGIVGLGRIGGLVAQRALAFGMHLIAYDPFVSAERARQMGVDLAADRGRGGGPVRLPHHPPAPHPGDHGADRPGPAGPGQAGDPHRQHRPGRDRRRGGALRGHRLGPGGRARPSTCSPRSRRRRARCSSWSRWW